MENINTREYGILIHQSQKERIMSSCVDWKDIASLIVLDNLKMGKIAVLNCKDGMTAKALYDKDFYNLNLCAELRVSQNQSYEDMLFCTDCIVQMTMSICRLQCSKKPFTSQNFMGLPELGYHI